MIRKFIDFISVGIWTKPEEEYKSKRAKWAIRQVKVLILTAKGYGEHDIVVRSAALTFYTLMSIVPIAALIFGIVKGFGMERNLENDLLSQFPQYSTLITNIIEFANNLLMRTKGGLIASVGFVVLLWAVMKVFGNIERAFNHIWEVRKQRSLARKFSDYITVVFIAPILWLISNSLTLLIKSKLNEFSAVQGWLEVLYVFASLLSLWLMFTFIYFVMPNTKVKIGGAFMAGILAGTVFQIFQTAYIYAQTQMSAYNAIYGSFAALPLFLIWLQASWQILLFGAELSFAYQNVAKYEQERESMHINYDHRRKITIASMVSLIRNFVNNKGGSRPEEIAEELNLPVRIIRDVLFDLESAGILLSVMNERDEKITMYVPAKDIHTITISMILNNVEDFGEYNFKLTSSPQMDKVNKLLDSIKEEIQHLQLNVKIIDLI